MRIGLHNFRYPPDARGGAARSVQLLAEGFAARGHAVQVVCQGLRFGNDFREQHGVEVALAGEECNERELGIFFRDCMNDFRPEVIITNFFGRFPRDVISRVSAELAVPWVPTLREYTLLCREGTLFREGAICHAICDRCTDVLAESRELTTMATAVVGISEHVLNRHLAEGMFANVPRRVIRNISPAIANQSPYAPSHPLRMGFLGRIAPEKGMELLLEAVAMLPAALDWALSIAGDGDSQYVDRLKARMTDPRIEFLGQVEADNFLPTIDLLVVPSLWDEPLGRVIHEAYAHGIPVICTPRGGMPEIVEDGRTGWIVVDCSSESLQQRLESILVEPSLLEPMNHHALAAASRFHSERICDDWIKFLSRLA